MRLELPGHVAALVDEAGQPVADGEAGEIVTTEARATLLLG
jgi:acyl-coenzyme A synthetase/AMP-(fatty) acid ligase